MIFQAKTQAKNFPIELGPREAYLKGDNHTVTNNVGWDDNSGDCTICVPAEHGGTGMNFNSVVVNNGAVLQGGGGVVENNYDEQGPNSIETFLA